MAVEDMKGLFPKMRARAAANAVEAKKKRAERKAERKARRGTPAAAKVGEDMSRAGQPGGGLTEDQALAMGTPRTAPVPSARALDTVLGPVGSRPSAPAPEPARKPIGPTQYKPMEGGKIQFSPKGDDYVYEYDQNADTFTIVSAPEGRGGVGATFGSDSPMAANFRDSLQLARSEAGATARAPAVDTTGQPIDSATPAELMESGEFEGMVPPMSEDAPPDESVFAPPGSRSLGVRTSYGPPSITPIQQAESDRMRSLRADLARPNLVSEDDPFVTPGFSDEDPFVTPGFSDEDPFVTPPTSLPEGGIDNPFLPNPAAGMGERRAPIPTRTRASAEDQEREALRRMLGL